MKQGAGSMGLKAARLLRWMLPCLVLLSGCKQPPRDLSPASVDGVAVTSEEVRQELRALLWRRGETWTALDEAARKLRRTEALGRCIEQRLLANFVRSRQPSAEAQASEQAFQQFLKQFEPPEGWKPRFDLQGLGEVQVRERIAAEVTQGSAIEEWLKTQGARAPEKAEHEARLWFDRNRAQLRVPDRARVSHLFLTAHDQDKPDRTAEIAELHRQITAGEATLAALAAKVSNDERSKKTGGSLGWVTRDRVPADFAEQIFTLPLHQAGPPFRTKLGWHIVLIHERQTARPAEFAEVKDEIMARLDQSWREASVKRLVQELRAKAKIETNENALQILEPPP